MRKVIIIGSGFAGLSAACFMAKAGWQVTVVEKNTTPGGRARKFEASGFTFDMGPSWYWMPDVFEHFFNSFGKKVSDYYTLERLDPSYRVYFSDGPMDVPANYDSLKAVFEKIEPGSGQQLDKFLAEAEYKYKVGIQKLVFKPGLSLTEFIDADVMKGLFRLDLFNSVQQHVGKHFKHPKLKELMEFPVLFLGALASKTPALYTLMNYADIKGGTWFPKGGMFKIVEAMCSLAKELGVKFVFDTPVRKIVVENNKAMGVETAKGFIAADAVIGGADYHHIETNLLDPQYRNYSSGYWDKRIMAPGCLIYYIGLNKKLHNILHHMLFFDVPFEPHAASIYTTKQWPDEPLFYVSATSITDPSQAPEGGENLFFLVPVAAGLQGDDEALREHYFDKIVSRFEARIGQSIRQSIVYKRSFAHADFIGDYNSFKGNAYGLANTITQTAILKPSIKSKKINNLYFTGQLTVPGPGVPPSLISGQVVARQVLKENSSGPQ